MILQIFFTKMALSQPRKCGQWDQSVSPRQVGLRTLGLGLNTNTAWHSLLEVNFCDTILFSANFRRVFLRDALRYFWTSWSQRKADNLRIPKLSLLVPIAASKPELKAFKDKRAFFWGHPVSHLNIYSRASYFHKYWGEMWIRYDDLTSQTSINKTRKNWLWW